MPQYSGTLRDNQANQIETTVGTAPTLEIRTGAPPANTAAADTGTVLATMTLPTDWLTAASGGNGQVARNGTWQDLSADSGSGATPGHFRIKAGATTHIQGTASLSGGGGELTTDGTITAGQQVTIATFTITRGNA